MLAASLPVRRLSWHYRSLDERLVAFANQQMYDGGLITFPGTGSEPVVRLETVEGSGVVAPGEEAIESTEAEVDRVVELVLEHARSRPQESLGVIALGIKHAARIEEALRRALSGTDGVGGFFDEDAPERFFVKNLERVQGDERDAIILSIGYGKTPHGRVLHRFGPLNLEGGERRLNVAITRSRRRMTVVSSLLAADLDPSRLKARGAVMLRDFLAYAESSATALPSTPGGEGTASPSRDIAVPAAAVTGPGKHAGSPVLAEFARRLRSAGLVVHETYGSSHPLDLAVEDPHRPGRVLVAVESDGPGYAAMRSTRDRDRLRVEQLGRLGWEHVRVWSTDLFRDPARDVARVVAAAQRASKRISDEEASRVPETPVDQDAAQVAVDQDAPESPEAPDAPETGQSEGQPDADTDDSARKRRIMRRRPKRGPEQTLDDTDRGWGEHTDDSAHDRWLQEQRPPHWGSD